MTTKHDFRFGYFDCLSSNRNKLKNHVPYTIKARSHPSNLINFYEFDQNVLFKLAPNDTMVVRHSAKPSCSVDRVENV